MSTTIRAPEPRDAAAIARLLGELGYPSDEQEVPARLESFSRQRDAAIWVAEHGGEVAGLATAHVITSIHRQDPVAMLTVLVVASPHQGHGVGGALLRHAEGWAAARGAHAISLTSALRRVEAHEFYRAHGYEHTGVRLAKSLDPR